MQVGIDQIDKPDSGGRTPLFWAIVRDDHEAIRQLLLYGPDCNKPDDFGTSPILRAARGCTSCTDLLLQANADVYTREGCTGNTVLHWAAAKSNQDNHAIRKVEKFVHAGIDVNAVNQWGANALYLTSDLEIAEFLIENGGDGGILVCDGNNALSKAIQQNNHALVRLFLQKGKDHTQPLKNYGTLIHMVAELADTETLLLLTQGGLQRRAINITNKVGLTAIELANRRSDVDAEWRLQFFNFLVSIDNDPLQRGPDSSEAPQATSESSENMRALDDNQSERSNLEFEDALEFQEAARPSEQAPVGVISAYEPRIR